MKTVLLTKLAEVPIIFITGHESAQLEAKRKPPHAPLVLARVRTYQRLKTLSETVRRASIASAMPSSIWISTKAPSF